MVRAVKHAANIGSKIVKDMHKVQERSIDRADKMS